MDPDRTGKRKRGVVGWPLAALLLAFPLIFSSWTDEAGYVRHVLACTLFLPACLLGCRRFLDRPFRLVHLALLGFLLVNLLSLFLAPFRWVAWPEVLRQCSLVALAVLVADLCRDDPRWRGRILRALTLATGMICAYALLQKLGRDPIVWGEAMDGRVFSTLGNPNMLAGFLVAMLGPLAAVAGFGPGGWVRRGVAGFLGIAVLLVIFWTGTRAALLGLAVIGAVLGWRWWRLSSAGPLRKGGILAGGIAGGVAFLLLVGGDLTGRLAGMFDNLSLEAHGSQNVRLVIWDAGWKQFLDAPVVGNGPGSFPIFFPRHRVPGFERTGLTADSLAAHAHCEYLELFAETGVLGLTAFLLVVGLALRAGAWHLAGRGPTAPVATGVWAGLLGLLATDLVSVNLRWSAGAVICWVFIGLLLAERRGGAVQPTATAVPPRRSTRRRTTIAWSSRLGLLCLAGLWSWHHAVRPFASRILTHWGDNAYRQGKWHEAVVLMTRALAWYPAACRALYVRGASHFHTGVYRDAIEDYRALRRLHPDFVRVHFNEAVCHLVLEQFEEAVICWDRQAAIGGLPAGLDLRRAIAETRSAAGRGRLTESGLEAILAGDPANIMARIELGNIHYLRGDFAAAAHHYEAVLERWPGNVPAWNNLAGILFAGGDHAGALTALEQVIALDPRAVEPRVNLIKVQYLLGRPDRALAACDAVLELAPGNHEAGRWRRKLRAANGE